ncbi:MULTISPECIES: response regulator transcription factor [Streptomyces]|uniref:Response regulator transcription factor n=1 Tax=Streptomyces doudnae TaxID=3075536 RepID=A0ABD5EKQ3_9ACTN|nr:MULTISPECIES: response regulator transcription factor [unclassified Streptomyces]MDT0434420.1 response regulator transcription factor [Streptomyces sp. DSM 41981]SCD70727.1 two component transcriptional regulator, LuxR family [Streptomyces sp. SolWspMP-5a-2]
MPDPRTDPAAPADPTGAPQTPPPPSPFDTFPPTGPPPPAAPLRVVVADDNPVVRAGLTALLSGRPDIEVVAEAVDGREAYEAARRLRPDVVLLDVRMPGVDGISALPYLVRIAPVVMLTYSSESEIVREALRRGAGGYLVHGEFTADQLVTAVRDIKHGGAHFTPSAAGALLAQVRRDAGPVPYGAGLPEGIGDAEACDSNLVPPSTSPQTSATPPANMGFGPRKVSAFSPHTLSRLQPTVGQSSSSGRVGDRTAAPDRSRFRLSAREAEIMDLIASGMNNQQIAAMCFISEKTVKNHINRIFAKLHSTSRSEAAAKWLGTARDQG